MPRPAIRRRQAVESVPSANPITNFTRVAKTQTLPDAAAKTAVVVEIPAPSSSRKRKASSIEQDTDRRLARHTVSFPPSSDEDEKEHTSLKRPRRAGPSAAAECIQVSTPSKGKRTAKATPSRTKTAHRPSQSTIITKAIRQEKKIQTKIDVLYQKKAERTKANGDDKSLPPQLVDLIALNKAFLKTIMIQISHSGSTAPIDIRVISPNVSRTWGKRQVNVDDIRRCIAIQSHGSEDSASPFIITDYGRGRVCVELAHGVSAASIKEDLLNRQFQDNIRALCAEKATDEMTDVHVPLQSLSLSDLPQAAITTVGNGLKANPLMAKGQTLLSELRGGIAARQQEKQEKQQAQKPALLNPDGTKMSLLDRLRHKQLARANEPVPPSGPELQRRAALNRVVDVAATISMLSLSNPLSLPRQAFAMPAISDKLRDSLRVPLSAEEGVACVRLIATEVAPEWLRIVAIGGRENVVIQRHGQPIDRVIRERVQKLLAA
ncbi:DNA mismatch repair protein Msh2 [Metarhizium guizhouense ARSEF 977]|uniref:DNA mismatch repair protein Msh2 n=1 Tax=Metarhizium guizhouense (strain ARSEF 977) TaxID=1276136 RepID=A0A0B4I0U0_METGA|nr:DNA mismatch repair protein Msh2 [Metarhizium guizhouense ARSEF 977]